MSHVGVLVGSFVSSTLLVWLLIHLAPRFQLLAHPNARSSHVSATPTMGGIAIIAPVLVVLALTTIQSGDTFAPGLLFAAILLALVGVLDDLRELSAGLRFCAQVFAVILLLYWLDPGLTPFWLCLIGLLMLWLINLYNFMDGIDGIAGLQALVFCIGAIVLAQGVSGVAGILLWSISGATVGFLAFNWPPARIFMGDVGSLVLGLTIGALVFELHRTSELPFIASVILLSGFWIDASYTLCVRMLTGQRFTQAHRSHLYQRLSDRLGHLGTTSLFGMVAVVWLMPLAWLSVRFPVWSAGCVVVAALPYLIGAVWFRAGRLTGD